MFKKAFVTSIFLSAPVTYAIKTHNNDKASRKKPFEKYITVIRDQHIKFREGHEDISLKSLSLRHRKFDDCKSNDDISHVIPGGIYNWYYINQEPIKCWKDNETYVIQDGHRRFIEGSIQGYNKFAVEVTGPLPEGIIGSSRIGFDDLITKTPIINLIDNGTNLSLK